MDKPTHLQHVRVCAQGSVYQLQLFIRLLMVTQLDPALRGLQVECVWRLERFHGGACVASKLNVSTFLIELMNYLFNLLAVQHTLLVAQNSFTYLLWI